MNTPVEIDVNFERSSIDAKSSYIEVNESGEIHAIIYPRRQTSENWVMRWLEPCFRLKNIKGKIVFIHLRHYGLDKDHHCHQTWKDSQRGHFSYDFRNWFVLNAIKILPNEIILSHDTPFDQNEVFLARSWPRSVTIVGENILALKNEFKELIDQTKTAKEFQPKNTISFPAQAYIAGEIKSCIDEIDREIPATPFYSFEINDPSFTSPKKNALILGGVHAGEDLGDLALWEFTKWVLGNANEAIELRKNYVIRVYPMVNAPGRYAGTWRTTPDSIIDTNRQWGFENPDHDCVKIAKSVIENELNGERLVWGLDFHSAPSGETIQIACKHNVPNSVVLLNKANSFLRNEKFGVYGDINSETADPVPSKIAAVWMRKHLKSSVSVTIESCDQLGPLSPTKMRPYSIALGQAIFQMHLEGYFEKPQEQ